MAENERRRPAGTGATADQNSLDEEGYRAARPKAREPAQWLRVHATEMLVRMSTLTLAERGVFVTLLLLMNEDDGPVREDARLARRCGTTKSTLANALEALLDQRIIYRLACGLWCDEMEAEKKNRSERSKVYQKNSQHRWKKENEIKGGEMQLDTRDKSIESERESEEGLQPSSHTSSFDAGDSNSRARTTRPARIDIGDVITVGDDEYELTEKLGDNFVMRRQTDGRPRLMDRDLHPIRWMEDEDWPA